MPLYSIVEAYLIFAPIETNSPFATRAGCLVNGCGAGLVIQMVGDARHHLALAKEQRRLELQASLVM